MGITAGVIYSILASTACASTPPDKSSGLQAVSAPTEVVGVSAVVTGDLPVSPEPPPSLTLSFAHPPYADPVRLEPLDARVLTEADRENPDPYKRLRIGVGRTVNVTGAGGQWNALPGGGVLWTAAVRSEGALALRLHVRGAAMPPGGELRFISAADPTRVEGPLTGAGPFGSGAFWSTILPGDEAYIEYRAPAGSTAVPDSIPFVIDEVQHVYRDPVTYLSADREGDCHLDVTCEEEWETLANAVAAFAFVDPPDLLVCTGELITTVARDLTPYVLTAGHCIVDDEAAQSMLVYWKYQTDTCGGPPPALEDGPTSSVGELLSTRWDNETDYSLVMIRGEFPPGSYAWTGWTASPVPTGTPCACIHHPDGGYKRISFGDTTPGAPGGFLRIDWTAGATEDGSSGAGAYLDSGDPSQQFLVGVLSYGPSSCDDPSYDDFASFREIYLGTNGIAPLLVAGADDVLEENDTCPNAAAVPPGGYADLVAKYYQVEDDWYRVSSSSCGPVEVTLNFTDAFGDIDMELYDACGGSVLDASSGTGDTETLVLPAGETRDYWLRVFMPSSVRNTYHMGVTGPEGTIVIYPVDAGGLPIPDNDPNGVSHPFFVPDHFLLANLKAAVQITHTWNGDLEVILSHNSTTVKLIDRPGRPEPCDPWPDPWNCFGFWDNGFDVILDDSEYPPIETFYGGGAMVVGSFSPNEPLSAFDGQDAYGWWTIQVIDHAADDVGTLVEWGLHVPPQEPCECWGDGDATGDGFTDLADAAMFQRCFTGDTGALTPPGCQTLNFDCDRDVDLDDYSEFRDALTGPAPSTAPDADPPGAAEPDLSPGGHVGAW